MKEKVSELWETIFKKYDILDKIKKTGFFEITADEIKEYKEPRLMTKFDNSNSRPKIFKENRLGILPIDNGKYVIGQFNLYEKLPEDHEAGLIKEMIIPDYLESIDLDNIYSENNALNVALLSGMISDIVGEDLFETISGRMRSSEFQFTVEGDFSSTDLDVLKPQIEIDGGYEGKNKIVVIEAKNNDPDDFIIRQLYYPYRFWQAKVEKEIVPIFFTYKNGVYSFYVYKFEDANKYNSISLVQTHTYRIIYNKKNKISLSEIQEVEENNEIPFPQADAFNKIKEIIVLVGDQINTAQDIANFYDITPRQGNYYLSAAKYLGIIEGRKKYFLTDFGEKLYNIDFKKRDLPLSKQILCHKPFSEVMKRYIESNEIPKKDEIITIMKNIGINTSDNIEVINRRASTIRGWIEWINNSNVEITL